MKKKTKNKRRERDKEHTTREHTNTHARLRSNNASRKNREVKVQSITRCYCGEEASIAHNTRLFVWFFDFLLREKEGTRREPAMVDERRATTRGESGGSGRAGEVEYNKYAHAPRRSENDASKTGKKEREKQSTPRTTLKERKQKSRIQPPQGEGLVRSGAT